MADRPFIFRGGSKELVLPVTPSEYTVEAGHNIEIVNIHELGDVAVVGYGTLANIQIQCLLPNNSYSFALDDDSEPYIKQLTQWKNQRKQLRFIVGNTKVNIPVVIEHISYGENDGSNDINATISLREYRQLEAIQIKKSATQTKARAPVEKKSTVDSYTIKYGDTLSAICWKYYGSASATTYNKLAKYNGIPNPHLIYPNKVLKIPQPLS